MTGGISNNSNVNNSNPVDKVKQQTNAESISKGQVEKYQNSIFDECDTNKNQKLEGFEVSNFKQKVASFIQNLKAKITNTQPAPLAPTQADVKEATWQTQESNDSKYNFDKNGNVQPDLKQSIGPNGERQTSYSDSGSQVETSENKDGTGSITVTNENGKKEGVVMTTKGYEVSQDGKTFLFDKEMNFLGEKPAA